jgi:hypothetical protein
MVPVSAASISYSSLSLMFGAGLLTLWLLLSGYNVKELLSRAITSLSGHFRARPDPWLERALRDAFGKFDRELEAILRDRDLLPAPCILGTPSTSATQSILDTSPCRGRAGLGPADPRRQEDPPGLNSQ